MIAQTVNTFKDYPNLLVWMARAARSPACSPLRLAAAAYFCSTLSRSLCALPPLAACCYGASQCAAGSRAFDQECSIRASHGWICGEFAGLVRLIPVQKDCCYQPRHACRRDAERALPRCRLVTRSALVVKGVG